MLDDGPSVGGIGDLIADEPWKDGCETEPGDVVNFFRNRNSLERIAMLRNDYKFKQVRYNYHGYICAEILSIPVIDSEDNVCYDEKEPRGGLLLKHFIGSSEYFPSLKSAMNLKVKVFELHIVDGKLNRCVESLPNRLKETGSTQIRVRQDITDPSQNECHPDRGGGPFCDFDAVIDIDSNLLIFPTANETEVVTQMEILAGKPNLAGNYRRTISVQVERNDNYRSVTARAIRNKISLGSKPRGGSGDDARNDDMFWATVPIDGLVYTVVHDPPGGKSYSELQVGSAIALSMETTRSRTASIGGKEAAPAAGKFERSLDLSFGVNLGYTVEGTIETSLEVFRAEGDFTAESSGPDFSVTGTNSAGWDMFTTLDRVIRSSEDPSIPGRAGDVILGGGVELVYKISDVLDIVDSAVTGNKPCLYVSAAIVWLPRKPTSYVFSVHSIESQIMPNLQYLLSVVREGKIAEDGSKMQYVKACEGEKCTKKEQVAAWTSYLVDRLDAWKRTLQWSSPEVYYIPTTAAGNFFNKD
jgi:hypothetical protein